MPDDTALLLERHFDTAFAAPDGIQKLRELILTLAMQGKLVPQDPNDQPASELLKEIEAEKQRLVKEGKIKQPKPLPKIKPQEVPCQAPKGWVWTRFEDIVEISSGVTKGRKINGKEMVALPYLRVANVQRGYLDLEVIKEIEIAKDEIQRFELKKRDLLITEGGDWDKVGRTAIWNAEISPCIHQNHVFRARCLLAEQNEQWLEKYLNSSESRTYFADAAKQTTNLASINKTQLRGCPIPLPPLAEQRRIVSKIDQLMARCDELEKLRAERNQKRITIHTAACDRLLSSSSSSSLPRRRESSQLDSRLHGNDTEFAEAWRFITQHFGELYSVKENVAELRKAILQLAVMGKLVPQDPNDEPASELLKEIEAEKQQLVKEGKIKKTKIVTPIETSDVPFPLPDLWIWARTEAICEVIVDCPHSTPRFTDSGFVCLDTNVFKNGALIPHKIRYVSKETYLERIKRLVPQPGDVVFAREGSVGESVIIPEGMNCCLGQRVMLFRLAQYVLPTYFSLALSERSSLSRLLALHKGIGAKHINVLDMRNALIPLPPIAEQRRIVAKIDQLMALCDALDQQIDAAASKQTTLLNAVMAQV